MRSTRYVPICTDPLVAAVGSGSFGVVLACTDCQTGEKVAVKVLRNISADADNFRRVVRELRLLRTMQHPNILGLRDALTDDDCVFFVTDLWETDLSKVTKRVDLYCAVASKPANLARVFRQVLSALAYLHEHRVLHRDIKPPNILINVASGDIKVRHTHLDRVLYSFTDASTPASLQLCDWGMARMTWPTPGAGATAGGNVGCGCLSMSAPDNALTEYVVTRWYRAPEVRPPPMRWAGLDWTARPRKLLHNTYCVFDPPTPMRTCRSHCPMGSTGWRATCGLRPVRSSSSFSAARSSPA